MNFQCNDRAPDCQPRPSPAFPCILLAAGASSRMGRQKLLLPLGDSTVIRFVAQAILQVVSPLIVVTGKAEVEISDSLKDLEDTLVISNPSWQSGMVSSAQAGISALLVRSPDCQGFFIHHADKPFVPPEVFAALSARAENMDAQGERPIALIASRNGKPGHPVYFPRSYIQAIMSLEGGERLRGVIEELGGTQVECGSDAVTEDMDNPGEYEALLAKYGMGAKRDR
ncbi:MAG: nucleotidyltransferase family protein [Spirochaetaceae bacterium]|nr:nucleotidyltransferase family protein [Spirochaetaceae bacterium]